MLPIFTDFAREMNAFLRDDENRKAVIGGLTTAIRELGGFLKSVPWGDLFKSLGEMLRNVNEIVNATLMTSANSWYMSANIPGKPRAFLPYLGPEGIGGYRKKCDEVAAKGYEGFTLA